MNQNLAMADGRRSTTLASLLTLLLIAGGAALILGTRPAEQPIQADTLAYGFDGDIFVAESDGTNPVRIADGDPFGGGGEAACGSFSPDGPMWSPDGRLLAFGAELATCGWEVWIADPSGAVIVTIPGTRPTWSPDATRVATPSASTSEIGIYGIDGVRRALLAVPPGVPSVAAGASGDLAWTRDGASILVWGPTETWELPIDARGPRFVPGRDATRQPAANYSPDDARVALVDDGSLWVGAADGSGLHELVPGVFDRSILWSPAGDRIAFIGTRGDSTASPTTDIGIVDPANGHVTWLDVGGLDAEVNLSLRGYASDGGRILYSPGRGTGPLSSVDLQDLQSTLIVANADWGDWRPAPAGS